MNEIYARAQGFSVSIVKESGIVWSSHSRNPKKSVIVYIIRHAYFETEELPCPLHLSPHLI